MLYQVRKNDVTQAGKVLADAFQDDPIWNKIFEGQSDLESKYPAFFEVPVRYCMKYGGVFAPSENLEGVTGWVPGRYADMGLWGMIRSGAMGAAMRMGTHTSKMMTTVFPQISKDRKEHMAGQDFIYLQIVGVATEFHGRGFGRQLIGVAIEKAASEGKPLYLETETENNVEMYEHFGFTLLKKIRLPVIDLPMWEMVKKPS